MRAKLAIAFAAGAFGGLANSLALWLMGIGGITALLGVKVAPALTPGWLYPRLVWGGIWGFLFVLPLLAKRGWMVRGAAFSLGPTLVQLFVVFPIKTPHGVLGLGLGTLMPLVVVTVNLVWGLAAAWLYRSTAPSRR